ncbi:hypothetical protein NDI76_03910 [Halogeometricum sp. S1BR25-6]|uniref:Uncharacterized protein n=1 Tax=Halogeometricum salsisoli TaxID=2950536 RepID=A0ABU2GAS1_9EURY|nr:hypothetical protein [Halogeometricum sp. S1BR25-6]MDS0297877.1 hypothetical protein [Halogeometricum sp. S1BR25-6]
MLFVSDYNDFNGAETADRTRSEEPPRSHSVFDYVAGDSTLLVALVGTVATLCASICFGLEYRQRRRGESAWDFTL